MSNHGQKLLTREEVKQAAIDAVERALGAHGAHHAGETTAAATTLRPPKIMGLIAIPQGDRFLIQELATRE